MNNIKINFAYFLHSQLLTTEKIAKKVRKKTRVNMTFQFILCIIEVVHSDVKKICTIKNVNENEIKVFLQFRSRKIISFQYSRCKNGQIPAFYPQEMTDFPVICSVPVLNSGRK